MLDGYIHLERFINVHLQQRIKINRTIKSDEFDFYL